MPQFRTQRLGPLIPTFSPRSGEKEELIIPRHRVRQAVVVLARRVLVPVRARLDRAGDARIAVMPLGNCERARAAATSPGMADGSQIWRPL